MWAHEFSNRVRNINNSINAHKMFMFIHKHIAEKANKQKRIFLLHTELMYITSYTVSNKSYRPQAMYFMYLFSA
jgi:hypothetical protein